MARAMLRGIRVATSKNRLIAASAGRLIVGHLFAEAFESNLRTPRPPRCWRLSDYERSRALALTNIATPGAADAPRSQSGPCDSQGPVSRRAPRRFAGLAPVQCPIRPAWSPADDPLPRTEAGNEPGVRFRPVFHDRTYERLLAGGHQPEG